MNLYDVSSEEGLSLRYPANYRGPEYNGTNVVDIVDCMAQFPVNATYNGTMLTQCAWAALEVRGVGVLNATVSIGAGGKSLLLTAALPGDANVADAVIESSSYGWGPIPMMNAYDKASRLPVLPWNRTLRA